MMVKRGVILVVLVCLSVSATASAGLPLPRGAHYRVHSNMDPRFVAEVERLAEAFYDAVTPAYFPEGFAEPLEIYYSGRQAATRKLALRRRRLARGVGRRPAVYAHFRMDSGRPAGWGSLFHEITHHFIQVNYGAAPIWFHEGLASFLGERTELEDGTPAVGRKHSPREWMLAGFLERGGRIDVRRLLSLSKTEFYGSRDRTDAHYAMASALFAWLHEQGKLKAFLLASRTDGITLATLERVVSKPAAEIDKALTVFTRTADTGSFM